MQADPRKKPPTKPKNIDRRTREYLTVDEVHALIDCARTIGRHGERDANLILLAYEHGLRPNDVVRLTWSDIDFTNNQVTVVRLKNGNQFVHTLSADERTGLLKLKDEKPSSCDYVFCSERKAQLKPRAVHSIIARAGSVAGLEFPIHPQMLRNSKGHHLALDGLDNKTIQNYFGSLRGGSASLYRRIQVNKPVADH